MDKLTVYENQTDEELIELLREGQADITDYIMNKYKDLVRKRAKSMFLIGGDTDDLIQEGMIGLFKAIRDYRRDKDASFYYFADICITRQIYNAVEASQRKKHQPLNSYISLSAQGAGEDFSNLLEPVDHSDPEQLFIDQENTAAIQEQMKRELSPMEWDVLRLHLKGINYRMIADIMEKEPKAIDNALQRIKGKLLNIKK